MNTTNNFIVLRRKKTGKYLNEYKNKEGRLVYSASWVDGIEDALVLEEEYYIQQQKEMTKLCELFKAEPIRIKAEYVLETLDGESADAIEYDKKAETDAVFRKMLTILTGEDD